MSSCPHRFGFAPALFFLFGCSPLLGVAPGCRSRGAPRPTGAAQPSRSTSTPSSPSAALVVVPRTVVRLAAGVLVHSGSWAAPVPPSWGFLALDVDLASVRLQVETAPHGAWLSELLPARGLAIVNGGYFDVGFHPVAWLRSGAHELSRPVKTRKGGVFGVKDTRLFIGPLKQLDFDPELAVQNSPLILEADGSAGIHGDDGLRAARTIVCQSGERLRFVLLTAPPGDGPTLFESVAVLAAPAPGGFACHTALNLDGGPSTGVWFAKDAPARSVEARAKVAYGIAVVPLHVPR